MPVWYWIIYAIVVTGIAVLSAWVIAKSFRDARHHFAHRGGTTHSLRYPLVEVGNGYRYGPWHITPADWIRPHPGFDWDWSHDDFDGAPDANDHRCGSAADMFACIIDIHEWEDDHED